MSRLQSPMLEYVTRPAARTITKIDLKSDCIFLDFDGTLVEFAEHPDEVVVKAGVREDVSRLSGALGGALAIVSGRKIDDIDHFLAPLVLPVAGIHGMIRRDAEGRLHQSGYDEKVQALLAHRLQAIVDIHDGLLLEQKPGSLAMHYRKRPDLESVCRNAMHSALEELGAKAQSYHLMSGKMVLEARASASTKASAIADYLGEVPFFGRRPVFAGDDVTDEDGFAEINDRGGLSIKVGNGETRATCRAHDIQAFQDWLHAIGR